MAKRFRQIFSVFAFVAFVVGCNAPPPPEPVIPELTYSHLTPFRMAVTAREIIDAYRPPLQSPNVDHMAPLKPAAALTRWAEDRLVAGGGDGLLRVTIIEGAITEKPAEVNSDLESSFTTEIVADVTATVAMRLEIVDINGNILGTAEANARRTRSLPEGLNLMQRDVFLFELVEAVMKDFDGAMTARINQYMSARLVQ